MKTIILSIAALTLLGACARAEEMVITRDIEIPRCDNLQIPDECSNLPGSDPANPKVMFDTDTGAVKPRNVCADKEATIEFILSPAPTEKSTVSVFPKSFTSAWLIGTDKDTAAKIDILVPKYVVKNTNHEYTIITADGKCVDPRIHVR